MSWCVRTIDFDCNSFLIFGQQTASSLRIACIHIYATDILNHLDTNQTNQDKFGHTNQFRLIFEFGAHAQAHK